MLVKMLIKIFPLKRLYVLVTINVIRLYLTCTGTCAHMYFCKRLWAMLWNTDIHKIEYSEGKK